MERVGLLIKCGIIPYIVFDGGYLPMKKLKEDERRFRSREKHREAGLAYLKANKLDLARQSFVKAVDVSPSMAHRVIQRLQETGVKYMVAPYEADAQMAYLVRTGAVDAVISEDSDCLPYGCHHVVRALRLEGKLPITKTYEADVARARLTFRHQRVYDPVSQTLTHVTPLPASLDGQDTDFLGPVISTELARGIAEGHIDPITGKPFLLHPAVTLATPSKALEFPADNADAAPILHTPPPSHVQGRPDKENAFTRLLQAGSLMPRSTTSKRKLPAAAASTKRRQALHPVNQPHANVKKRIPQVCPPSPRSRLPCITSTLA
ncbi:hypothetical protein DYB38_000928 [Aphanomyces astaci]|uniref:XPG-I domain-containing protein n=1 Tax=Aphanomyces astaci TaxID=112090 RepID=A0A397D1T6_APHAT|nr:hypothetical protein DYB38_000928 [Aphanomyces astaci]